VSASFWQQDANWSVQQRSFTRSFNQVNQNWTQKLSGGSPPGLKATAAPPDQSGSASIINPDVFAAQAESHRTSAPQPDSGSNSGSTSSPATSRNLLDLLA
jgi:hypothetical protein